ncbi:MAG: SH3 domain-containing protein [Cyclobacteriaceae bacterium]
MKLISALTIFISTFTLISCSTNSGKTEVVDKESSTIESSTIEEPKTTPAVCIWDQIAVRETPSSKGKYITSLSVGESLESLGVDSLDTKRTYTKVKLGDGTIGWSIKDFVIANGQVATFLNDNSLFKRPDLLTKTENSFSQMDIVAITSDQEEWVEIIGKRKDGEWIESGWVKKSSLSLNSLDVAVAKFGRQALEMNELDEQIEALKELIENNDFSSSNFIPSLQENLDVLLNAGQDPLGVELDSTSILEKSPIDSIQ